MKSIARNCDMSTPYESRNETESPPPVERGSAGKVTRCVDNFARKQNISNLYNIITYNIVNLIIYNNL